MTSRTDQDHARRVDGRIMPPTIPNRDTITAERDSAGAGHRADRQPTDAEAGAADDNELSESVKRAHREAIERGANIDGEGQIAPT